MKRMSAVLLAFSFFCSSIASAPRQALKVGSAAPEFSVTDLAGNKFTSAQLKGNLTVLDVWATWCEPCVADIPLFNRLHAKYAGRGIRVIGIAVQSGSAEDIKLHVAKLGIQYQVLVGTDRVVENYVEVGFPITYLIAPDGTIAKKYLGSVPDNETGKELDLDREINRFIQGR